MLGTLKAYSLLTDNSGDSQSIWEFILLIALLAGYWKICEKGGTEGWRGIIPFYNYYKLFEIVAGNGMLFLTFLIPPLGAVVLGYNMAKAFGKDTGFMLGLILLPYIFVPILGFGNDSYYGPKGVDDHRTADARKANTVSFEVKKNDEVNNEK